ncbi:hypothetical protein [Dethiothermospora halolimnae]|uniref:hypothetical protein n=1 Tax=Dethiothermospora halolimnae TaxID=3114390 RepID=UPI003CCC01D1
MKKYKQTLEGYIKFVPEFVVQSHGDVMENKIIKKNIDYISKLIENEEMEFEDKEVLKKHLGNVEYLDYMKTECT